MNFATRVNNLIEKLQRRFTQKIKVYKKFKSTKSHVDEDIFKEARNAVQNLIRKKEKTCFEEKLTANTANP